jgi:hypothetical protein
LTDLNMQVMHRIRRRLSGDAKERLLMATYDETIRFNILLIDGRTGVIQPYLPNARGVAAPTLVVERCDDGQSLYDVFASVFASLWDRGIPQ